MPRITYMWNLKKKKGTNELIYNKIETVTDVEGKLTVTKGKARVEG